jgi:thiol:disulfide interchange protein
MRTLLLAAPVLFLLASPAIADTAAPRSSAPASISRSALVWVEDDYVAALARARAAHVPMFVDVWAPWCHTCRSMKAYVFTDASLQRHAKDFVIPRTRATRRFARSIRATPCRPCS